MLTIYVEFFERWICMNITIKKAAYIVSFFIIISVCALLYYAGYYYTTSRGMFSDNLIRKKDVESQNPLVYSETKNVTNTKSQIVTKNTKYIVETYNIDEDKMITESLDVPVEILGYDRERVSDYLDGIKSKSSEKNLINIQLKSFSGEQIVVRKTIVNNETIYKYFVISENDVIKIYNSDKKTLFADTGISITGLDEEYKNKLTEGFYIETIHELYNYLESVTS